MATTFTPTQVLKEPEQLIIVGTFTDSVAGTWSDTVTFTKEEISACATRNMFLTTVVQPRFRERANAYIDSFNKMKIAADWAVEKLNQPQTI